MHVDMDARMRRNERKRVDGESRLSHFISCEHHDDDDDGGWRLDRLEWRSEMEGYRNILNT